MASFDELQNHFVTTELTTLGYATTGQVLQPAALLPPSDDHALWTFFNTIPPDSQIYMPGNNRFFTSYSALINSLIPGDNPLDPIVVAKRRLSDWGNNPPNWNVGYAGLKKQLSAASSFEFSFHNDAGPRSGFWGLWSDSPTASGPSVQFAAGNVSADLSFSNMLSFSPTPGDWYVSSALSLAYATKTGRPWNSASPINWQTTFGPNGTLPRFPASLLVVAGMHIKLQSTTLFNANDQQLIRKNEAAGLWPYYLGADDAQTSVQFDPKGRITITITSEANVPIAIAVSVLPAKQFLGG